MKLFKWLKKKPIEVNKEIKSDDSVSIKRQRTMDRLKLMLEDYPYRLSGSKTNVECSNSIKNMFDPFCTDSYVDSFYDSPLAFRKWPYLVILLYLVAISLLWTNYNYLSVIPFFLSLFVSFRAGFLSKSSFKFLFGRQKIHNVIAKQYKEENKKTIIFSSHLDSAPILRISKYNKKLVSYLVIFSFVILLFGFIYLLLVTIIDGNYFYPRVIFSSLFPIVFSLILLTGGRKEVSKGAGDNLVSVALLVELSRHFCENPLENTNIIYAAFDGEEAGLLGSSRYYKYNELALSTSECININLDNLFNSTELSVLFTDINGSIKLDKDLSLSIISKAKEMGYTIKSENMALFAGATDAASAIKHHIPSATIIACNPDSNISHSKDDIFENIDKNVVGIVIDILIKLAKDYDLK